MSSTLIVIQVDYLMQVPSFFRGAHIFTWVTVNSFLGIHLWMIQNIKCKNLVLYMLMTKEIGSNINQNKNTVKNKTLWLLKSLYFSVWTLWNRDKPLKSIFDSFIEIHTLNDRVETLFYMDESLISRVISLY